MVGMALAKSLYAIPTWTKTVALVARALGAAAGRSAARATRRASGPPTASPRSCASNGDMLERCIDAVVEGLQSEAADLRQRPRHRRQRHARLRERPALRLQGSGPERDWHSDPDASWGHRSAVSTRKGGGFFGYRLHAAVCTATDLPVAWAVETAKANETAFVADLLDTAQRARRDGGTARWTRATTTTASTTVRRARLPAADPAAADAGREARRASAALLRARRVDLRRVGPQARRDEVAVPDRRVQARLNVGCGRPPAPADPARDEAVESGLPEASRSRARVRPAEARVGLRRCGSAGSSACGSTPT